MNKKTQILHAAAVRDRATGALSIPIFHASTYHHENVLESQEWEYGRSGNPTRCAAEELLCALEGGAGASAFSSGVAAISGAITAVVKGGDHIVAAKDIYGGTYRFLTKYISKFGVEHTFVDTTNPSEVRNALKPNTRVLLLESPSNPLLRITDIDAMVSIARAAGIITIIDNTFMTPYLQKPLDRGIDISLHSATKFLGGHSDLIAGVVICASPEHASAVKFVQNTCGAVLSPNDSWLLIRGIKTLSARMDAQSASAQALAEKLTQLPWVKQVYYPGLETHQGHGILKSQASGFGAVVSVEVDSQARAFEIMRKVKLWNVAVSLGGVESILSYPVKMSHASIPRETRENLGISDMLLRLSVGLEDGEDLLQDLVGAAGD